MNYSQYYLSENINTKGLKPVYGATGLGKTYGIKEYIKKILNEYPTQKFIYITNRHALIQELHRDLLKDYKVDVCYLKGNNETLKALFNENQLLKILYRLIEKDFFRFNNPDFLGNDKNALRQHFETQVKILTNYNEDIKESHNQNILEKEIEKVYARISKILKEQFFAFKKPNRKKHQEEFLNDKDVWELFPFIKFENNPNINVLVGTVQKFCRGFFNGKRDLKLHDIEHKNEEENLIVFLDEFDFLENEVLTILCEEPQLNNSIEFVRFFMEDFEDWRESEFWEKDKDLQFVKNRMQNTYNFLQDKIKENRLNFPKFRRFIFDNQAFEKGKNQRFILFQNNNTILSETFYLQQKKQGRNAFKIVKNQNEDTVSTYAFFGMIKAATEQLLRTFDSVRDRTYVMNEIIHYIWNTKNDNTIGEYHRYISENYSYRTIKRQSEETDFSYHSGFSLITIKKDSALDPDLAEVEQLELITSPESIIAQLASKNLVFALSATADIVRMVNAFNINWLKLNINFIEPSLTDIKLVELLKEVKFLARTGIINEAEVKKIEKIDNIDILEQELKKYSVSGDNKLVVFSPNVPINQKHSLYNVLKTLKDTGFYEEENDNKDSQAQDFRVERSLKFFGCLEWIAQKSKNRTHLIFTNSFKREILFFDGKPNGQENSTLPLKFNPKIREKLTKIGFQVEKIKSGYRLIFQGKTLNIIFLNARRNKELGENLESQTSYDDIFLDPLAEKVILVTQYATASNGLNLRCIKPYVDDNGAKIETDFEGIHLLEAKHFWFDTEDENRDKKLNNKKKAFWYLWKLYKNQELGEQRFKNFLKKTDLNEFNSFYKTTNEYTLSQIALFHQALGRGDRKKIAMPPIEVSFGQDVKNIFIDFLEKPFYQEMIKNREKFTATFILRLNEEIIKHYKREKTQAEFAQTEDISLQNQVSKDVISSLLSKIQKINRGEYVDNTQKAKEIIKAWQELREYVLKQDFKAQITFGEHTIDFKNLTCETLLMQEENKLFLSIPNFKIYPEKFKADEEIKVWDLNLPFQYVVKNDYLKREFTAKNFAISYQSTPYLKKTIFTPYIEQAVLRGAIGEEAIKILLHKHSLLCLPDEMLPQSLFELFDARLQNTKVPIYLDFKNYSKATQRLFELDENDFFYEEAFDSKKFLEKVQRKLKQIRLQTNEINARYVVVNFVSSQENKTKLFDIELQEVKFFADCSIAVVPSTITVENPNSVSLEFEKLVHALHNL